MRGTGGWAGQKLPTVAPSDGHATGLRLARETSSPNLSSWTKGVPLVRAGGHSHFGKAEAHERRPLHQCVQLRPWRPWQLRSGGRRAKPFRRREGASEC